MPDPKSKETSDSLGKIIYKLKTPQNRSAGLKLMLQHKSTITEATLKSVHDSIYGPINFAKFNKSINDRKRLLALLDRESKNIKA